MGCIFLAHFGYFDFPWHDFLLFNSKWHFTKIHSTFSRNILQFSFFRENNNYWRFSTGFQISVKRNLDEIFKLDTRNFTIWHVRIPWPSAPFFFFFWMKLKNYVSRKWGVGIDIFAKVVVVVLTSFRLWKSIMQIIWAGKIFLEPLIILSLFCKNVNRVSIVLVGTAPGIWTQLFIFQNFQSSYQFEMSDTFLH